MLASFVNQVPKHNLVPRWVIMQSQSSIIISLLCSLSLLASFTLEPVLASGEPPEWSHSARRFAPDSQLEQLNAAGKTFYALLSEPGTADITGHILLLHGARQHPDWPQLIRPLRLTLPKFGWTTFSIELPDAGQQASDKHYAGLLDQATAHILAAQGQLQGMDAQRIVMIAYGLGARMAVDWLSKTPQSSVSALVLISMADGDSNSGIDSNQDLLKIKVPILDIYAEHDDVKVRKAAHERSQQRGRLPEYRQLEIYAANQYYNQQEDELIKRIRGWLKHTFAKQ
jgi:pimeloyl-ACP methyl ester carboxylesterase